MPVIPFWFANSSSSPELNPLEMRTVAPSRFVSSGSATVSALSTTTPAAFSV